MARTVKEESFLLSLPERAFFSSSRFQKVSGNLDLVKLLRIVIIDRVLNSCGILSQMIEKGLGQGSASGGDRSLIIMHEECEIARLDLTKGTMRLRVHPCDASAIEARGWGKRVFRIDTNQSRYRHVLVAGASSAAEVLVLAQLFEAAIVAAPSPSITAEAK